MFISFESTSAPTTSARLLSPLATIPYACAIPYMKPVQPGREVVRGRVGRSELVGQDRGGRRELHVRRDGGDDQQVDVLAR